MKSLTALACVVIVSSICHVAKSDQSADSSAEADYYAQYYKDYYNSLEGKLVCQYFSAEIDIIEILH